MEELRLRGNHIYNSSVLLNMKPNNPITELIPKGHQLINQKKKYKSMLLVTFVWDSLYNKVFFKHAPVCVGENKIKNAVPLLLAKFNIQII